MARDFDGTNDYITITRQASLEGLSALTIAAWFYATGVADSNGARIFHKRNGATSDDYALMLFPVGGDNRFRFRVKNGSGTNFETQYATDLSLNQWYHVAGSVDVNLPANRTDIYVDGVDVGGLNGPGSGIGTATEDLNIGGHDGSSSRRFTGRVAECAIWNRKLDPNEIAALTSVAPLRIPEGLVFYMPVLGVESPEPSWEGSAFQATHVSGPLRADHPPIVPHFDIPVGGDMFGGAAPPAVRSTAHLSDSATTEPRFTTVNDGSSITRRVFNLGNAPWILPAGADLRVGGGTTGDAAEATVIYKVE